MRSDMVVAEAESVLGAAEVVSELVGGALIGINTFDGV